MASLVDQIKEALVAFARLQTPPALIGGLALAAHNVVRATRDVLKSSSTKSAADHDRVVLVSEGGVERMPAPVDPIQAWIDLMGVVEMLRPPGGPRPRPPTPTTTCGRFLL